MKVVIIGGVAGGATAAARLRRLDEHAEIIVLERTGYVSYANCGLPYYIGNVITDRAKLTLQTPQSFLRRFNIDIRVNQEAARINRAEKTVEVKNLSDGTTYIESYDKLILSPGAKAVIPDLPGVDSDKIFTLRTVEDTFAIYDYIEKTQAKNAVVVGAGFIGLEMAENLVERGIGVTVLQRPAHVMATLDGDIAALLHNTLRDGGINLRLRMDVTGFETTDAGITTFAKTLEQNDAPTENFDADLVILAIGVRPESSLAKEAGLELGIRDSIKTDDHMRTSDPDIYAAGDAVQVKNWATGSDALISLAGPANKQGRIIADNICGIESTFKGSQGSSVMKAFDMTVATTGISAEMAQREGIEYDYIVIRPGAHAGYYPGGGNITLKVLFRPSDGLILGAQAIGKMGVEKRIDVIATAMHWRATAHDLVELDLSYAPPYSSAKDPVNMAGFTIENIVEGRMKQVQWSNVENLPENTIVLDTRTQKEWDKGHIEGAMLIPVDELRGRLDERPRDNKMYVHCQSGLRSYIACRILLQEGFDVANVAGGYGFYDEVNKGASVNPEQVGDCGL